MQTEKIENENGSNMMIRKVFDNYSGKGKFKTKDDSAVYDGDWVNGVPHGKGKLTYENGSVYEGEFAYGGMWGQGKQTYKDGRVYEGGFYYDTHDQPVGEGTMTYPDGRIVKGGWKNCKFVED